MTNRRSKCMLMRHVWIAVSCAALCLPTASWADVEGNQLTLSELRAQRKKMAHRHQAPAYPCLKEKWDLANWPLARGEALYRFSEEADGVTTFNRFDPTHRLWRELGDTEELRKLPHE